MTKAPATVTNARVMFRETRIVSMIATLNDLEVKLGNILIKSESDQKMGYSITPTYSVMLKTIYASIIMQILC